AELAGLLHPPELHAVLVEHLAQDLLEHDGARRAPSSPIFGQREAGDKAHDEGRYNCHADPPRQRDDASKFRYSRGLTRLVESTALSDPYSGTPPIIPPFTPRPRGSCVDAHSYSLRSSCRGQF